MIKVKVTYSNKDTIITSINTDLEGAKRYYLGRVFNLGNSDNDLMVKAILVEKVI